MCREETEDLRHFILDCRELEATRLTVTALQIPRMEDWKVVIGEFLFGREKEENRRGLYEL